ncbi:transposase [Pseudovibrio sp. Tun.PSC04-5.I4]|uniref:transposase n=1 Tax=Pseudovibrio sp. Tun.PSC04-5.I4 TaxID=1798213 RepID=UPI001FCC2B92|nr:transposase [Pseudovibrio sp. Tun.PSC04-5.I4]
MSVKSVFGLALRQTQGFVRSVFALTDLNLPFPDYSTLSRRAGGVNLSKVKSEKSPGSTTLVIDSTGVKMFRAGE